MKTRRTGNLSYLATRVFGAPLMIHQGKLDAILGALGPRLGMPALLSDDEDDDEPAPRSSAVNKDGVAVIPVLGTLVKRGASLMAAQSGLTSCEAIKSEFAKALADPSVKSIVFDFDSPGGEVAGVFELAQCIFSARGKKPLTAVANSIALSGAYLLASAADRVLINAVGSVGSIGALALHCDQSQADQEQGLKYSYIFSGASKVDGHSHAPLNKSARTQIQAEVDRIRNMFVESVARYRGAPAKSIFGTEAQTFMGIDAIPLLADGVADLNDAMKSNRGLAALDLAIGTNTAKARRQRLMGRWVQSF
jgi:capsid assembly protease